MAGGALLALGDVQLGMASEKSAAPAAKPLRLLILGGTGFIGPHYVRAAVKRGHNVSVFNRGKDPVDFPPGVERLLGDRNGDLESIKNRDWDAVLDLAVYTPIWVRTLGQALKGRVKHYTFISTVSTYDTLGLNSVDENSKLLEYKGADPYSDPDYRKQYGPMKVIAEREAEQQFPKTTLILRPGYIVGPGDRQQFFTYWPARMEQGGEVLVPGNPLAHVQFIDVRDLAQWTIRMMENAETGVYNVVGPAMPMSLCEMLGAVRGMFSAPMTLTWVPVPWLDKQNAQVSSPVRMWWGIYSDVHAVRINTDKAQAEGLIFRPLHVTAAETLAWHKTQPEERQVALISDMPFERKVLAAWHHEQ